MMEFILVVASLASLILWARWYAATWPAALKGLRRGVQPWLLPWVPVVSAAIILLTLCLFAASDVVSSAFYILAYFGLGALWLRVAEWLFRYLGISAELDVFERGNRAALAAYAGGLMGVALCYSGGNIGEGPGAEVVIFCAALATIVFFLVWWVMTTVTEVDYTVTVDRDLSAGLRLGAFLLAAGLILGRAVTGDWVSASATFADFFTFGWPVLLLLVLAILIERFARPTVEQPAPPVILYGLLPAAFFIACAVLVLVLTNFRV